VAPSAPGDVRAPVAEYDTLTAVEVIAVLPSLQAADLEALRRHESGAAQRSEVIDAIDRLLAPSRSRGA